MKDRKQLIEDLKSVESQVQNSYAKIKDIRKQLERNCLHEPEFVTDYQWEHDNGYGIQKLITGERCELCGAFKRWKGSSHWISRNIS